MRRAPTPSRGRRAGVLSVALLLGAVDCSYLAWRHEKHVERDLRQLHPTLLLEKEFAPEGCYVLTGRAVAAPPGHLDPFLVAAFEHRGPHDLVGSNEVDFPKGVYGILLPSGEYDVLFFADLDQNGFYETHEVVGRSDEDAPIRVEETESRNGVTVEAEDVVIDRGRPGSSKVAVRVPVARNPFVVASVEDPIFAPELGEMGVYQPNRFLARTQNWAFSLGEPDFSKPQVVLVHGINGTPRDFSKLVAGLDRSRYQVWLFYYPTGLSLDKLGIILARVVQLIAREAASPDLRMALVAHSMGGLVGRRAVNELCLSGRPDYLRAYASFDTPYGGIDRVAGAVRSGTELVPSWKDIAAGSDFLTRLHQTPLPEDLPFHLFFGWGNHVAHGPTVAGDGTIALGSQLDPRAQAAATATSGYPATHVGVLSDPGALSDLSRLLDAAIGAGTDDTSAARSGGKDP